MDQSLNQETATEAAQPVFEPRRTIASVLLWARKHGAELLSAGLLTVMSLQMLAVISRKCITTDEIVHIPAGYYHLVAGDFELNNEHPPLVKMWAALPLLFVQPDEPPAPNTEDENFMERTYGFHARFWQANKGRFESVTFWPRVMMIPITLALGVLIFVFARKLFGDTAAVISVGLYVLEPTVLAHGHIVHTDVPAALVYLLFFFALYQYSERPRQKPIVDPGTANTGTAGVSPASSNAFTQVRVESDNPDYVAFNESGRDARGPSKRLSSSDLVPGWGQLINFQASRPSLGKTKGKASRPRIRRRADCALCRSRDRGQ